MVAEQIQPVLEAHAGCGVRWLDAEAVTAACSDVLLVETDDLRDWHHLWEQIRDSDMFTAPYFRLEQIVLGSEDAYLDYEHTIPAQDPA